MASKKLLVTCRGRMAHATPGLAQTKIHVDICVLRRNIRAASSPPSTAQKPLQESPAIEPGKTPRRDTRVDWVYRHRKQMMLHHGLRARLLIAAVGRPSDEILNSGTFGRMC